MLDCLEDRGVTIADEEWSHFDFKVFYSENDNSYSVYVSHKDVTTIELCVDISYDYTLLNTEQVNSDVAAFAADYVMMKRSPFQIEDLIQIIYDEVISSLTSTSKMQLKEKRTLETLGWEQIPWSSLDWTFEFYYSYLESEEKERFPGGRWAVLVSYPYEFTYEEVSRYLSSRFGESIPKELLELNRILYLTWLDIGIDAASGDVFHIDTFGCYETEPYE